METVVARYEGAVLDGAPTDECRRLATICGFLGVLCALCG